MILQRILAPIKKTAFIACSIALVFFCIGLILPDKSSDKLMQMMMGYLKNISFSFVGIFTNNLKAALILFLGGVLFGLPSVLSGSFNFLALGTAFKYAIKQGSGIKFIASILPHGLFEIPAILIAFSLGLTIAGNLFKLKSGNSKVELQMIIKDCVYTFLFLVLPLLLIAAAIEVFITPKIITLFR